MGEKDELYTNFVRDFGNTICSITAGRTYSNVIFLCIGTDRLIGDAFGPIVGSRLTTLLNGSERLNVIGNLNNTVSLCNINSHMLRRSFILNATLQNIRNTYTNPFIVAIDAALSTTAQIGSIKVSSGGVCLGSSLYRQGITVGDMSIRGIVGKNCRNANQNMIVLQNIPLNRVVNMAEVVATGIANSINYDCNV